MKWLFMNSACQPCGRQSIAVSMENSFLRIGNRRVGCIEVILTGSQNATTDQYRRTVAMLATVPHIDEVVTNRYDIERGPEAYASRLAMDGLKSLVQFAGVDAA